MSVISESVDKALAVRFFTAEAKSALAITPLVVPGGFYRVAGRRKSDGRQLRRYANKIGRLAKSDTPLVVRGGFYRTAGRRKSGGRQLRRYGNKIGRLAKSGRQRQVRPVN
jgi:hypothetical protein